MSHSQNQEAGMMSWNAGLVSLAPADDGEIMPCEARVEYFELPADADDATVVAHARKLFGLSSVYGATSTDLDSLVFTPHGADFELYVCPA